MYALLLWLYIGRDRERKYIGGDQIYVATLQQHNFVTKFRKWMDPNYIFEKGGYIKYSVFRLLFLCNCPVSQL